MSSTSLLLSATKNVPSQTLLKSFNQLKCLSRKYFKAVLRNIFEFFSLGDKDTFNENLKLIISDSSGEIESDALEKLCSGVMSYFMAAFKHFLVTSEIESDLKRLGLKDDQIKDISVFLESDQLKLKSCTQISNLDVNKLVDLDWKFGITTGTSEKRTSDQTFIQLKLRIDRGNNRIEPEHF
eukprot:Pgem_evm1s2160